MKRAILFFVVVLLLLGGLGCWQHDRIRGFMAAYGFGGFGGGGGGGGAGGAGGGGGGGGVPQPTALMEVEGVRVVGIINSARPSAVINAFGKVQTVMVGEDLLLPLSQREAPQAARCESINGLMVTLAFPAKSNRMQLVLSK